eukprot:9497280-Pyramimonas_sp.AAC.1
MSGLAFREVTPDVQCGVFDGHRVERQLAQPWPVPSKVPQVALVPYAWELSADHVRLLADRAG